jgi:SAM-dependent methyltransferase
MLAAENEAKGTKERFVTNADGRVYSPGFFEELDAGSLLSARSVVPILNELLSPNSVIDVGCGTGAWLAAWRELGVSDVCGVDGDYVDARNLRFPASNFVPHDLAQPLDIGRRFDLVMSVEVAEHIDERYARTFIESLIRHGDLLLFSAAIPGQGGTRHVNEQWASYWARLFAERGYLPYDVLRTEIWSNTAIEVWYRQNAIVFATETAAERHSLKSGAGPLDLVHPELFTAYAAQPLGRTVARRLKVALSESALGLRWRSIHGSLLGR